MTTLVKDFFACRCNSNFLFTQTNELAQIQGKVLAGFKVVLQEILMDIRSSTVRSSVEPDSRWDGAMLDAFQPCAL